MSIETILLIKNKRKRKCGLFHAKKVMFHVKHHIILIEISSADVKSTVYMCYKAYVIVRNN